MLEALLWMALGAGIVIVVGAVVYMRGLKW